MARDPIGADEEVKRIQLLRATRVRQMIAALSPDQRKMHEGAILTYMQALRDWEKGNRQCPEPPIFLRGRSLMPMPSARPPTDVREERKLLTREQIKAARRVLGWSQMQLAQKANVGREVVGRIEQSHGTAVGSGVALAKIRKALEAAGLELESLGDQG